MSELKPCPIMISASQMKSAYCIGKDCAWWCEFAGSCSISLIAGILADSTICQNVFEVRAGDE